MPNLLEVQRAISASILAQRNDEAARLITSNGLTPGDRLGIYRNTFLATLTTALRLSYPAIRRLVGEEFFDAAAHCFIAAKPPKSAYLTLYGQNFPDFLAEFPPVASLPYLRDVARLEWAVNCALHAFDAKPLDPRSFSAIAEAPPERLVLVPHPSVALLQPKFPADGIWRAVLSEDDEALGSIKLSDRPNWLLVERRAGRVEVSRLGEDEGALIFALCAGQTFSEAMTVAAGADVPPLLAARFAAGSFIDFFITDNETSLSETST